jgi:glucokinase
VIDAQAIGAAFGLERVVLVNDYTPVAASVVALSSVRQELVPLGTERAPGDGARVVLGPGTGLGVAALIPWSSGSSSWPRKRATWNSAP